MFAVLIAAGVVYGVALFIFEPEGLPGSSRAATFKCLSRAERTYFRQLRWIADERREHLITVHESLAQLESDRQLSQDLEWRRSLSTDMARFTLSSREMAQINRPPSARAIQRNLFAMSESATSFTRLYLHGVRTSDSGAIAEARTASGTPSAACSEPRSWSGNSATRASPAQPPSRRGRAATRSDRLLERAPTPPPPSRPSPSAATAAWARRR